MAFLRISFAACALLAVIEAAPVADVTVTNVVTETHVTIVDCVKTVWVPSPTATSTSIQGPSTTLVKSVLYTTRVPTTTTTTVAPPAPTTTYVPVTTLPSTTSIPAPTTPAYTPPAPETTESPVYTPPAPETTESPVYTPPPTTEAPAAAQPTTSSVAPEPTPVSSSGGGAVQASTSNNCESASSACEGDITHYDGGLGACGWNVDTASDMAVALPFGFMGTQSNSNPYCGRTITIKNPNSGTTMQAKVSDKCMGCTGRSIDLTDVLFSAITDGTGNGRESGYEWWFT